MKENLILMMLLLTGAGSMNGQMIVTGKMVNTGALVSAIPIETVGEGTELKNTAPAGDIKTVGLTVGAGTLVTNEGSIYVGSGYVPTVLKNVAMDYDPNEIIVTNIASHSGDVAKDWTNAKNDAYSGNVYNTLGVSVPSKDLWVSEFVYSGDAQVSSRNKSADRNSFADLSPLKAGIDWAGAVMKCADLVEGGYTDWYLPNAGELKSLMNAGYLGYYNLGTGGDVSYWSSTEDQPDKCMAARFTPVPTSPTLVGYVDKTRSNTTYTNLARCVRRN